MRIPQKPGARGSLKWIQRLIARDPDGLTATIRDRAERPGDWSISWRSPLEEDDRAEYRDGSFLDRVGHGSSAEALNSFWPRLGPQWDGLGVSTDGGVVLVEAKANVPELASTCTASSRSLPLITDSLSRTKAALGVAASADWLNGYYQYANRLAHLHFLQSQGIPAILAFVYFLGDGEVGVPASEQEWQPHLAAVYGHLGLPSNTATLGVCSIFVDTRRLAVA